MLISHTCSQSNELGNMNKPNRLSLIYALSAVFFWSTVATAFKISLEGLHYSQLLFYSSLTSCIALGIFARKEMSISSIFSSGSMVLGFLNPFLYYIILFNAYSLLPAQEAQPLNFTWPIVLSLFSVIFLKEKINSKIIIGLISAFIGVVIIATRGNILELKFENIYGVSLAVGTSIVWASFWIMNLKDKRQSIIKLFGAFFWGSIFSGAAASAILDRLSFNGKFITFDRLLRN